MLDPPAFHQGLRLKGWGVVYWCLLFEGRDTKMANYAWYIRKTFIPSNLCCAVEPGAHELSMCGIIIPIWIYFWYIVILRGLKGGKLIQCFNGFVEWNKHVQETQCSSRVKCVNFPTKPMGPPAARSSSIGASRLFGCWLGGPVLEGKWLVVTEAVNDGGIIIG